MAKAKSVKKVLFGENPSLLSKVIVSVVLLGVAGLVVVGVYRQVSSQPNIRTEGYQQVVLDNGQVFYGKLSKSHHGFVLNDVYYIQAGQTDNQDAKKNEGPKLQLTKHSNDLAGPIDGMYINAKHVVYWENIKDDGQVAKTIEQEKKQEK